MQFVERLPFIWKVGISSAEDDGPKSLKQKQKHVMIVSLLNTWQRIWMQFMGGDSQNKTNFPYHSSCGAIKYCSWSVAKNAKDVYKFAVLHWQW